jgi:four helix bundle protein
MARDYRRLRVFQEAHQLVLAIYRETKGFPRDEWFGIRAQIRRASVSVPSNIVEGSARRGTREYLNFLNIARGSAGEMAYLVRLSSDLGFLLQAGGADVTRRCENLVPQLESLVQETELLLRVEIAQTKTPNPKVQESKARG